MVPMAIVIVQPAAERGGAVSGRGIGHGIRPFTQQGLDEPLGFAIGAGGVGPREAVGEVVSARGGSHQLRAVPIAIVTEHPLGDDAAPPEPLQGAAHERHDRWGALVRQHFRVRQARAIIHADVNELPPAAPVAVPAIAGHAMPDAGNAAELFGIDVQQLPRARPLIALGDGVSAVKRARPSWAKVRATVARLHPTTPAISAPVQRRRRSRSISTTSPVEIARGERWGRHERSSNASSPSAARVTHFRTVRSHTPTARATAATGSPWCTRRAIKARLLGVVRAFLWMSIRNASCALMVVWRQPPSQRRSGWTIF